MEKTSITFAKSDKSAREAVHCNYLMTQKSRLRKREYTPDSTHPQRIVSYKAEVELCTVGKLMLDERRLLFLFEIARGLLEHIEALLIV